MLDEEDEESEAMEVESVETLKEEDNAVAAATDEAVDEDEGPSQNLLCLDIEVTVEKA